MDIVCVCDSYLNGFNELADWKNNEVWDTALAICKIVSYVTLALPFIAWSVVFFADRVSVAQLDTVPDTPEIKKEKIAIISDLNETSARMRPHVKQLITNIPPISFTEEERERIESTASLRKELEDTLSEKYGSDFDNLGWHGRMSQQRILWQNPQFLNLIQDPLVIKLILLRRCLNMEKNLGAGNKLSSLLLHGLANNNISYLATASPNWDSKPRVRGVSWSKLEDMRCWSSRETSKKVSLETLKLTLNGLNNIETVIENMSAPPTENAALTQCQEAINSATSGQILSTIDTLFQDRLLDVNKTALIVQGQAGASTGIDRMTGQCLEVMTEFDALLKFHGGDHAAVLGYGLVSHALDSKHLLAAIIYGIKLNHPFYRRVQDLRAINALKQLLDGACDGSIGPWAAELMRIRLQQVMSLIVANHETLKIPLDTIRELLTSQEAAEQIASL